jgi:hypothetical protein
MSWTQVIEILALVNMEINLKNLEIFIISNRTISVQLFAMFFILDGGGGQELRNRICFCWLHWNNFSWQNYMFFRSLTLCSARVSALVIVWKNRNMVNLSNFGIGQAVGARLAGASVTKSAILLNVLTAAVYKVMSAYTNHGMTSARK